jgi:hypothetical protein
MDLKAVMFASVVSMALVAGQQVSPYVFDALTMPAPPPTQSCSAIGQGCVSGQTPATPLAVDSFTLDRNDYVWGEDAIAEILLGNRGKAAVTFPWSLVRPPCDAHQRAGFQPPHAALHIEFADERGDTVKLWDALTLYYGTDASSTIVLAPHESIRFRVPIHLRGGVFRPEGFTFTPTPIRMSATATWQVSPAPQTCDVRFTKPSVAVNVSLRTSEWADALTAHATNYLICLFRRITGASRRIVRAKPTSHV